jgi:hypothetical protein
VVFDLSNPDCWRVIGLAFVIATLVVLAIAEPGRDR